MNWKPRKDWLVYSQARDAQTCQFCHQQMQGDGRAITNGAGRWDHLECAEANYPGDFIPTETGTQRTMTDTVQSHEGEWLMVRKIPGAKKNARYEWKKA